MLEILKKYKYLIFAAVSIFAIVFDGGSFSLNKIESIKDVFNQEILPNIQDEGKEKTDSIIAKNGYEVVKIVDGDTITVDYDGKKETIRVLGINTPETLDPRRPVECFGKEASEKAKDLLLGNFVSLEKDESQSNVDKYDRLLRYVFLENGTDYGKEMIKQGYAYEYTYDLPYKYQVEYKAEQEKAKVGGLGLWKAGACEDFKSETKKPE